VRARVVGRCRTADRGRPAAAGALGRVLVRVHGYEETALPGGAEPTSEELVESALGHVIAPGPLATLVVDPDDLRAVGARFRVDPGAGKLVPL